MSISQNFPNTRPSLNLNFARSKTLDPRITFSRTSTGTYVDESGVIRNAVADEPRFDHDPETGECLGLLIEEQRSNLITYSSDMSQWSDNNNPIYADNDTTAPDGTVTADKLTGNNFASDGRDIAVTISTNTTYTVASFIKPTDQPRTRIGVFSDVDSWYGNVDTDWDANGEPTTQNSVGASNIKYEPYPNGWYRVSFQFTSPATINGNVSYFHMPDRTISGKSAWFWGAQLEAGAFPTSYIPRLDTSTATRNPDTVSMTGDNFSDWYNQSEGSILWRGTIHSIPISGSRIFEIYDSSGTERMAISVENNELMYMRVRKTNETTQLYNLGTVSYGSEYKIGLGVDGSSLCLAVNDEIKTTISDSFTLSSSDTLIFTDLKDLGGARKFTTRHIGLSYYPVKLPNSTLQTLTK